LRATPPRLVEVPHHAVDRAFFLAIDGKHLHNRDCKRARHSCLFVLFSLEESDGSGSRVNGRTKLPV
jgi:hypothetical protein